MEDAQIIELFFVRSEDAISELDKKYGKLCHKLADNILASAQDAEECVNDAYLSTWNAIPPRRKKEGLHALREVLLFISFQFARYFSRSPSGTSAPPVAQTMCAAFSQCAPRPLLSR